MGKSEKKADVDKQDELDIPEWLLSDEFGSREYEVFTHPRTKEYLEKRYAHDQARERFDELAEKALEAEDGSSDLSLADADPRQEELEQLSAEIAEAVEAVNELAEIVKPSRHVITVRDMLDLNEYAAYDLGTGDSYDGEAWSRFLEHTSLLDGEKLPAKGWLALARKCGVGQWASFTADAMAFLTLPGVTPDFSPLASPTSRE